MTDDTTPTTDATLVGDPVPPADGTTGLAATSSTPAPNATDHYPIVENDGPAYCALDGEAWPCAASGEAPADAAPADDATTAPADDATTAQDGPGDATGADAPSDTAPTGDAAPDGADGAVDPSAEG